MLKQYSPIFLTILILTFACSKPGKHTVHCKDMQEACGDDCPQYKIYTIDGDSGNLKSSELDVYMNHKLDSAFNEDVGICAICYTVNFTGELDYNSFRECYEMEVQSYELVLRPDCCDQ